MNSAIYQGWVTHHRYEPVDHAFRYRIAIPLFDLDEVDEVCARHPLWSSRAPAPVRFRRRDYLGPPDRPLAEAVRDVVEERTGTRPAGAVRMLAHVRTWGWLFNPIVCFWCGDPAGEPSAFVADVTSTPWHERHAYVADSGTGEQWFDKALHVSPFLSMDQRYRITFSNPGERLNVRIESHEQGRRVLDAAIGVRRVEISRSSLGTVLWRYPLMTARVSAGIYVQAARLKAKGVPFYPHPDPHDPLRGASVQS